MLQKVIFQPREKRRNVGKGPSDDIKNLKNMRAKIAQFIYELP
jgi:hypothetical protein